MIWKSFRTSQLEYIITLGCILIAVHNGLAAPVYDSTEIDTVDSNKCYYNYNHYYEGDRILTNEPCLNCTCHNRMLMCYLRVCPFTKPIGQDCVVERREDQCCPIITCPEVPVELDHHTTSHPITAVGGLEKYGCSIEGEFYPEGAQVPSNQRKPCELCYCIRNMTACVMQECTLHIDGCQPIYNKGVCCPVRYNCEHDQDSGPLMIDDETTTTERPTPGFMITTTVMPGAITECIHDTDLYSDGEMINTDDPCEHCYCMKGDIVCAVQECGTPLENRGKNCTAQPPKQGQCCPDTYQCEMPESTTILETMDHVTEKTDATTFEPQSPTTQTDIDDSRRTTVAPETMITDSGFEEEATPREDVQVPSRVGDETAEQEGKPRTTTTSAVFDQESLTTTPTSHIDDKHKEDSGTTVTVDEQVETTTHADIEETPHDAVTPTQKVVPFDSVETIDSTTAKYIEPQTLDDVTTQKIYDVPTPHLSDDELQQHIDEDDNVFTKKPQQSDDEDKLIEFTTHLYTDIGTTLRPHPSGEKMDSEEDNTVKPYDSTTIESKDRIPIDRTSIPTSSPSSTTQSDSEENVTGSKLPSDIGDKKEDEQEGGVTTQQAVEDDDSKTDKPQIALSSTLKPTEDVPESTTPVHVVNTENKTFKMEDQVQTEKYDELFASFVPGEGSCLLRGVTYANNSIMPPLDVCQVSCTCINSNVICDNSRCDTSPEQGVLCDADGNCGEDVAPQTEGSAQVTTDVEDEDLMAPQEGSAQGEISCPGGKCDGSESATPPAEDGPKITSGSGDASLPETPAASVGSESTTSGQGKISCSDGECDESDLTTPIYDDKSESATPAPEIQEQSEIACADGKCDQSQPITAAPGFISEFSTTAHDDASGITTPAQGEPESGTPAQGYTPELSTAVQGDASKHVTPAKGKPESGTLAPGIGASETATTAQGEPESETPAPGIVPESSTSVQDEIACADGKCDGLESATPPAPSVVPESSTPAQGEAAESATPPEGEITCADGKCDGPESATPAQGEKACTDGNCDDSESATPAAPIVVPEFSTPAKGEAAESSTPVQGEVTCADGKCDGPESATPAQGDKACTDGNCDDSESVTPAAPGVVPESSTPAQGEVAESSTPAEGEITCADGKCDGPESATPAQGEKVCTDGNCDDFESATPAAPIVVPEFSTPAQGEAAESATPVQGEITCADGNCDGPESATPAQGDKACTDGNCDDSESATPAAPSVVSESSTPAQGEAVESATPTEGVITCADGKCDGPESATPAQGVLSESSTPTQEDASKPATPPQDAISCANGKCDELESATPKKPEEFESSTETKADGPESSSPAQVDEAEITTQAQDEVVCADGKCDRTPASENSCANGKCDGSETATSPQDSTSESSTPAQDGGSEFVTPTTGEIQCADGKCDQTESVTPAQSDESNVPVRKVESDYTTPSQVKISCSDGKCDDEYESSTPAQDARPCTGDKCELPQGVPCIDGNCDETELATKAPGEIPCADGKCDGSETESPAQGNISCTDDECVQEELIPPPTKITPDETPVSCTDGNCDEPITTNQDDDLQSPTKATPTQVGECTSLSCIEELLENLNKTSEPVNVIQVVTVLPETQTTLKADLPAATEATPDSSSPTTTEQTDQQKISQPGEEEDQEQPDKDTIITRIQVLQTTTESVSDIDQVTDIDRKETSEQPDSLTEQSVTEKDSFVPIKPSPVDESEVGHKTDINKPSVQAPEDQKPIEQEPIESSTLSDKDVSEMITSLPVVDLPKVEIKPTATLPTESQNDISEPDTTDKPLDIVSQTTVKSDTPISDITSKPLVPDDDLELDTNLRTTLKPISVQEQDVTTYPSVAGDHDLEKPVFTTARPIETDDLPDKTDSPPAIQLDVQTTTAPIDKVTDLPEVVDDHDISTVGSIDEQPTVSDIKPEVTQGPSDDTKVSSLGTTSAPGKVRPIEDIAGRETTTKTSEPTVTKETSTEKFTDLDNKTDIGLPTEKDDVTEASIPVQEVPHPTVIAPIHGEEPQNQMGVTDQYDDTKMTTKSDTETEPDDSTTEKVVLPTVHAEPEKKPDVTEMIDRTPITDDTIAPTTLAPISAGVTDLPSRIDDSEIVSTPTGVPQKPIDIKITLPKDDQATQTDITTQSYETTPIRDATDKPSDHKGSTDKPYSADVSDKPSPTDDNTEAEPIKEATDKPSSIDDSDMVVTKPTPSQEATDKTSPIDGSTASKDATERPSPMDDDQTTPSQYATDKPISMDDGEATPSKDAAENVTSHIDDEKEPEIITAGPAEDATDRPIQMDTEETTPSKTGTAKPTTIDGTETTPSEDATGKPSATHDGETTPSRDAIKESTDKTSTTYDDSKESDIITVSPADIATDKPSKLDDSETTPNQDITEKPYSPIDGDDKESDIITVSPIDDATAKPSSVDRVETTPSQDTSSGVTKLGQDAVEEPSTTDDDDKEHDIITIRPIDDATAKPSPIDQDQTTPSEDDSDKPHPTGTGATTPAQDATEKPGPIDGDYMEPDIITVSSIGDATDKPSSVDRETTPSQDISEKPQPTGSGVPTRSQDATEEPSLIVDDDKESDVITIRPTDDATAKPSPIDQDQTTPSEDGADKPRPTDTAATTPAQGATGKPGPIDGEDKESDIITVSPIGDATHKPSSVDLDVTTPQDVSDKPHPTDSGVQTPSHDATEKPSPIDAEDKESDITTARPIDDATAKPSPIDQDQTTPSEDGSDKPHPTDSGVTTPSQDATEKPGPIDDDDKESDIITVSSIGDATDKPSSTDRDEATTTQDDSDKPRPTDTAPTTPTKDATEKPGPIDSDDKESAIITDSPIGDATDRPSSSDRDETTPTQDGSDKPHPIDSRITIPSQDVTEQPSPIVDDKESDIITARPIDDASAKPSPIDQDQTTPSEDGSDKPHPMDKGTTTPSQDASEKPSPIDEDDKESDIITVSPIGDATDKPSSVDRDATTPTQEVSDKPRPDIITARPIDDATTKPSPIDQDQTTPSEDGSDRPHPMDMGTTTPSQDATEKPSPIDEDDKESDIITDSLISDATDKPSSVDRYETTPSQDVTDKPRPIDSAATTPSQDVTDKPSPTDIGETTPSQTVPEKSGPIEVDNQESDITTISATGRPSPIDGDTTPHHGATDKTSSLDHEQTTPSRDATDKPSPIDDGHTTPSQEGTDDDGDSIPEIVTDETTDDGTAKPSSLDSSGSTSRPHVTDKPSPTDDGQTISNQDATDKPSSNYTDKPGTLDSGESTPSPDFTDKPSPSKHSPIDEEDKEPQIVTDDSLDKATEKPSPMDAEQTTFSQDTTDKPTPMVDGQTKPSKDDTEKPISTVDDKAPETITVGDTDDDASGAPGQEATERPIGDITTVSSTKDMEKPESSDDSDKEMDVTTVGGTPDATEKPSSIDDSDINAITIAQIKPIEGSPEISTTALPSDTYLPHSEEIDSEKTTVADSEPTTAKTTKPTPIDGASTPSEDTLDVTSKPETSGSTGVLDQEYVTIKTIEPTSDEEIEELTGKPTPVYDVDDNDLINTTTFAPSDSKSTPSSIQTQKPTDKPSPMDYTDKEVLVSTTVSDVDVVTVIATKLDEAKPQSSTEDNDTITSATVEPSKGPQDLTEQPDGMDDSDKEVAGSTPSQKQEVATDKPSSLDGGEKVTTVKPEDIEKDVPITIKSEATTTIKDQDKEITASEIPSRLDGTDTDVTTQQTTPDDALVDELFTKTPEVEKKPQHGYDYQKPPEDKFDYTKPPKHEYTPTISHPLFTTQAPPIMETPGYGVHAPPQPPQYSGNYPDEEYGEDEDPAAYGPGTCRYSGKIFVSAQQIPRDDPCDFCFCFRSDIICLQQSCPPPINGCEEEGISGFCCPRYNCHVKMATVLNVTTSTTTTTTTLPPHFMHHAYKGAAKRSGCQIKGQAYQVGDIISSQSGPCMSCICGGDGQMQCEPKVCSPEPMLQQMIAVAAANRRRR